MIKKVKSLVTAGIICTSLFASNIVKAKKFTDYQTVESNKTWTIKFTGDVQFDDSTKAGITVTNSEGNAEKIGIEVGQDAKTVKVTAPQGGYIPGKSYILEIGTNTHSKAGKALKNKYELHFTIKGSYVVTFKDKNLEQAIRTEIHKPTGDIYKSDVENITSLEASNDGITNISGIENLNSLQQLNLSQNQITNTNALEELSNLRILNLSGNEISDISSLKNLSGLYYLDLDSNQISNISVLKNFVYLQTLLLSKNQISNIDSLQELTKLQQLSLKQNRISDISSLTALTNLNFLYLGGNQISDYTPVKGYYENLTNKDFDLLDSVDTIVTFTDKNLEKAVRAQIGKTTGDIYKKDVEKIVSLQVLDGGIRDISGIENLTNLQYLDLSRNEISVINQLKDLSKLETLLLSENQISDINALQDLTNLKQLSLDNNRISDIEPLKWLTKLEKLYLNYNRISDVDILEWLTSLKVLYLGGNQISDYSPVKRYYDNLTDKDFKLSDSTTQKDTVIFKDENLEEAVRKKIDKPTGEIYKTDVKNIVSLDASDKDITDISGIENLINLQTLDLSHNEISDISELDSLTDLETLDLSYNEISDISKLRGLSNLETLNLNNNQIGDISAIQGLDNLKSLNLSNNKISDIDPLKGLNDLQSLWLNNNRISDADKEKLEDILSNCIIH